MNLKNLRLVNVKDLNEQREEFGELLRLIEYLKDNPNTKRADVLRVFKKALEYRDLID